MSLMRRMRVRLRQPRHREAPERDVPRDQVPTKAEQSDAWHERKDVHVHHDHREHARPRGDASAGGQQG